jgi:hypothetical protein
MREHKQSAKARHLHGCRTIVTESHSNHQGRWWLALLASHSGDSLDSLKGLGYYCLPHQAVTLLL